MPQTTIKTCPKEDRVGVSHPAGLVAVALLGVGW